jgi:hypothetical protein
LRITWGDGDEQHIRRYLWATHNAVNRGVKVFGDWLLTLRGGLSHDLADAPVDTKIGNREPTTEERRDRRVLLALSWLSVESAHGAPSQYVIGRHGLRWATEDALAEILTARGVSGEELQSWLFHTATPLRAAIQDSGVWVNRSAAFDDAVRQVGPSLTRAEVWDLIGPLFGSPGAYLSMPVPAAEDDEAAPVPQARQKELRAPARQWLSSRFGSAEGADFGRFVAVATAIEAAASDIIAPANTAVVIETLRNAVAEFQPATADVEAICRLLSGPGRKSGLINVLRKLGDQPEVDADTLTKLIQSAQKETAESSRKVGMKGRRPWADAVLADVERACGFRYRDSKDRVNEFSVMLDHAARRVSATHSWIKLAEQRRQELQADAAKLAKVPVAAREWLERYCDARTGMTGALEPYRIRKRAVEGWEEVADAWASAGCVTPEDRVEAVRAVQSDPEIRFGDGQLFEDLAEEAATCVWQPDAGGSAEVLNHFADATDALDRQVRFKVPLYRHPDPLLHPVFCEFGNSRWRIRFDAQDPNGTGSLRQAEMDLFDGASINAVPLRWQSKRLAADLALEQAQTNQDGNAVPVSRANRLGRAASGAAGDEPVHVMSVFEEDHWNGRLQAPREQLRRLAEIRNEAAPTPAAADRKFERELAAVRWLLTFSPRLQQHGPWLGYAAERGLNLRSPNVKENKGRGGQAQLQLARLDGLRVLSVDLGQRYAAACAVWEAVTAEQVWEACDGEGVAPPNADAVFIQVAGKKKTTFRRVGENAWARLDRSFVIRLAGEDAPARKASPAETGAVRALECEIGFTESGDKPKAVDELMTGALRVLRLGLQRHARRAGISVGFAAAEKILPGGRVQSLNGQHERINSIANALADWWTFATGTHWTDASAFKMWSAKVEPRTTGMDLTRDLESVPYRQRREAREKLVESLRPVAESLRTDEAEELAELWRMEWLREEARWRKRLRWIKDWLLPRGCAAKGTSIRHTGGLSIRRLENLRGLYRLERAFAGRLRIGAGGRRLEPQPPSEAFGQKALVALERLRDNRVKQTASRIIAAALGLGKNLKSDHSEERFAACHAVVIENLTHYRPDEVRTRRENRQLMNWCAAKVGKYLAEGCDLHGLLLREVQAAYTSRQDAFTGAPGVRCKDVPIKDFMSPEGYWEKELRGAEKAIGAGKASARNRYLVAVRDRLAAVVPAPAAALGTVRIPVDGGPVFVSANARSPAMSGIQADINAAANIGLRALLDPDWPARWWYIPCDARTAQPLKDKVKGSTAVIPNMVLPVAGMNGLKASRKGHVVNLWRDVSAHPLTEGSWQVYADYRESVMERVTANLLGKLIDRSADLDLPF